MSFNPNDFISKNVASIPKSGIREFFSIVADMPEAVSLGIGEPDFITPWNIRESAIFALEKGKTSYTDNRGTKALRYELSKHLAKTSKVEYNPDDEIFITVGVSEAMDIAIRAITNPGDFIMYHEPCFVSYNPTIRLAYANPIAIETNSKNNFALTVEDIKKNYVKGTKAIILNFPTNPTGATIDKENLQKIADFIIEKDMLVISDDIYSDLMFEGEHTFISSLKGMKERTILLHGFSKAYAMTGFRLGYACGAKEIIDAMVKIHQYSIMCASILSQEAALEALKNGEKSKNMMREKYMQRRDYIVDKFNSLSMDCFTPKGTFYAFPSIKKFGMTSSQFAKKLLLEQKTALIPGTAFGECGEGFLRASFSTDYATLEEAAKRIEIFINSL